MNINYGIFGSTPRQTWLKNRVSEVIESLQELAKIEDWEKYRMTALELSKELLYATTEWGRYYND